MMGAASRGRSPLDGNPKLCRKGKMLNRAMIFAAAYSFVLPAGVALWIAQPWTRQVDWRIIAAFVQAFLSAGAIFSAWWLQERKRKSDRAEVAKDTATTILYLAYNIEFTVGRVTANCRKAQMNGAAVYFALPPLKAAADAASRLNVAHMPGDDAIKGMLGLVHSAYLAIASFERAVEDNVELRPDHFDVNWAQVFTSRSQLLVALGEPGEPDRTFVLS